MVQIDVENFLPVCEKAGQLCFLDIECSGLNGDYNSVLCVSVKTYKAPKIVTFTAKGPGDDKELVKDVRQYLNHFQVWVTYYGKFFDIPMLQSRLLFYGQPALPYKHHLDLYWIVRGRLKTSRRSQAHLLRWLDLPEEKMSLSPEEWNKVLANYKRNIKTLVARCESDVRGLEVLYDRIKHLGRNVTR